MHGTSRGTLPYALLCIYPFLCLTFALALATTHHVSSCLIITHHHHPYVTLGGEISVHSDGEGKGSSFAFTLPMEVSD